MVSICSGAFALAQARLLDGLTVTTHWSLCDDLARQHPSLRVDPAVLFVDNGLVLTSGGVTAGVDLLLHILRKDLGASTANHVARRIAAVPRREGNQAQFIETAPAPPGDDEISAAQQWMLSNLSAPITVEQMATQVNMSRRNFHRRFLQTTSMTPLAWLHQQRIGRTKELLEVTNLHRSRDRRPGRARHAGEPPRSLPPDDHALAKPTSTALLPDLTDVSWTADGHVPGGSRGHTQCPMSSSDRPRRSLGDQAAVGGQWITLWLPVVRAGARRRGGRILRHGAPVCV